MSKDDFWPFIIVIILSIVCASMVTIQLVRLEIIKVPPLEPKPIFDNENFGKYWKLAEEKTRSCDYPCMELDGNMHIITMEFGNKSLCSICESCKEEICDCRGWEFIDIWNNESKPRFYNDLNKTNFSNGPFWEGVACYPAECVGQHPNVLDENVTCNAIFAVACISDEEMRRYWNFNSTNITEWENWEWVDSVSVDWWMNGDCDGCFDLRRYI